MDIRELQQSLPQAFGLFRSGRQLGVRHLSAKQQGWDYAASTRAPTVAQSATEGVGTLRALGLSSAVAPPFTSNPPEITSCLPPVSSTETSLSILPDCREVYDALHNVIELSSVSSFFAVLYSVSLKVPLNLQKACVFHSAPCSFFVSYGRSHTTLTTFAQTLSQNLSPEHISRRERNPSRVNNPVTEHTTITQQQLTG